MRLDIHRGNGDHIKPFTLETTLEADVDTPTDVYKREAYELCDALWRTLPSYTLEHLADILNLRVAATREP